MLCTKGKNEMENSCKKFNKNEDNNKTTLGSNLINGICTQRSPYKRNYGATRVTYNLRLRFDIISMIIYMQKLKWRKIEWKKKTKRNIIISLKHRFGVTKCSELIINNKHFYLSHNKRWKTVAETFFRKFVAFFNFISYPYGIVLKYQRSSNYLIIRRGSSLNFSCKGC